MPTHCSEPTKDLFIFQLLTAVYLLQFVCNLFTIFRVHMLEEHIRELELQSQEKLIEEQKRNKELLQRLEREKALELENYSIRLQSAEREQARYDSK